MLILGLNEAINKLAMTQCLFVWSCVEEREWSCVEERGWSYVEESCLEGIRFRG